MRRRFVSSGVLLGLTLVGSPSCKVQVGNTAEPATPSEPTASAPAAEQAPQKDPAPAQPESKPSVSVWGHFTLPTPDKTIERVAERVAPPGAGAMLNQSQLRSLFSMMLEGRDAIGNGIDFTKPMGCVVVDAKRIGDPLVCAVGYQGGFPRFVEDMGQQGYVSGGPDFAAYTLGADTVYFKAVGDHVGIALDPVLLAAVEDEMVDAVLRRDKQGRDVVAVADPEAIMSDARDEISMFLGELERAMDNTPNGGSAKGAVEFYRSFADLDAAEFSLKIGSKRTRATYRGTARADTPTAAQYGRDAALPTVDVALIESLPDEAFFVGAGSFDFEHIDEDPWVSAYLEGMSEMKGPNGTDMGTVMKRFFEVAGASMQGPFAFGAFPLKGTAGVMGGVYLLKPGADVLTPMYEAIHDYKAEDVMPELVGKVKTTYKRKAFRAGGVDVDTYTVAPTKKMMAELSKDPDFKKFSKAIGKPQITMAMAQKDGRYYLVVTSDKPKKAMMRMFAAAAGKGNLGKFGDARKRVKKHADHTMLTMLDVKGALAWARTLDVVGAFGRVPNLGVALDDVVWTTRVTKKGKKEHQLSVSQPFLDQVRSQ